MNHAAAASERHLSRTQTRLTLLLAVAVIAGASLWYRFGDDMQWLDNFVYDLHIKWRGRQPLSGQVALVLMDRDSALELDRLKGQWRRSQMARALDHLCDAGASVIGVDLILHSRDPDPAADVALTRAIERCGNVVLAMGTLTHGSDLVPLETFRSAAISEGFIDLPLDRDEVLRRIRFFKSEIGPHGIELIPSFSLELARAFLDIDYFFDFPKGKPYFVMGGENGRRLRLPNPNMLIDYRGDATAFVNLSYADVVNNRFDPSAVEGKAVIIGSSLATSKDVFSTPFTRFGPKTGDDSPTRRNSAGLLAKELGLACHAHAAETILSGNFIRSVPVTHVLLLTSIVGVAGFVFYLHRIGTAVTVLVLLAGIAGVVGGAHLLFRSRLILMDVAPLLCAFSGQFICGVTLQKFFGKKRTAMITDMFSKYVPPAVVEELLKTGVNMESRKQEITILFSDLRSFTSLSERLGPTDTGRLLNTYFDAMIPLVFERRGTLDKLIGDAIMAFFGAPVAFEDHPAKSAQTALDMLESLESLKKEVDIPGMRGLRMGIGLNTDVVIIGNLGCERFVDYTVIGDPVNLASRLEGLNKLYRTQIIVSEFTAAKLDGRFLLRKLDRVRVKGKKRAVTIFELIGYRFQADDRTLEVVETFESAFEAYLEGDWRQAGTLFQRVLAVDPGDGPALLYLDRVGRLAESPPAPGWDGVTAWESK